MLSRHQSSFLQLTAVDRDAHSWTTCSLRHLGAGSSKWFDIIKPLPSGLRGLCGRGSGKVVRTRGDGDSKEMVPFRYKWTDAHMNTDHGSMHRVDTGPFQTGSQHGEDEEDAGSYP